ncbi:hypothetical protein HPP92_021039 [Vanilla planifolia]|uniref:Uncharacterized protein n=1 Tax=Vanilla planifolia TaxID=51239 RepID=A0A835UIE6_VANPL|nr:hypothetical protein HPP92_021039 [Vanilla planifolia]
MPWATHVLQWAGQREGELSKPVLSSDCRLQLACLKPESLVIAGQPYGGRKTCRGRPSRMVDTAFLDIRTESNNDVVKIMEANGTVPNRSAVPDGNLVVENDAGST